MRKFLSFSIHFSSHHSGTVESWSHLSIGCCSRTVKARTAHDPKHTTSSVKHGGGSVGMCRLPVEPVLLYLLMMWLRQSIRMNSEVFRAILSAHIQPNASELIGRRFTVQMDNTQSILQKQQRVFEGKAVDGYAMAKSITWPESDWACISLAEDKTEGKMPQEQAGTEDGCSRGLAEHHQGWNPASGDVYAFQTSGCNWLQRICNQVIKKWKFDLWLLFCPITFGPLTSGRHICKLL